MKVGIYSILILILVALLAYGRVIPIKLVLGDSLNAAIGSVFGGASADALKQLQLENADLKAQAFNNEVMGDKIKVYSTYPFNNPTEILIAAGTDKNIKVGDVVTFGKTLFVGKVSLVFGDYSVVDTIFDPRMKIAVRVGAKEAAALFRGGNNPQLTLLSRDSGIAADDFVYTAQKDFKYGLEVGKVKRIVDTLGDPVKSADVEPEFQLKDLRDVQIRS